MCVDYVDVERKSKREVNIDNIYNETIDDNSHKSHKTKVIDQTEC